MARNITETEWQSLNVMSCSHCNLKTTDAATFQAHPCKPRRQQITAGISYSLASAKFTCSLCTVELSETEFSEHLERHMSLKPYVCKYCSVDFATRSDICQHLKNIHVNDEQTFVLKLTGRTKEIMKKAKNNGKEFYKPLNMRLPDSNNDNVAIRTNLSQNLAAVPRPSQNIMNAPGARASHVGSVGSTSSSVHGAPPTVHPNSNNANVAIRKNPPKNLAAVPRLSQNIMNAPAARASYVSSVGSTSSSVHSTVPTVNPPVPQITHSHVPSQPNSNTASTSARPQLPSEQRRYVLIMTQPQTGVPLPQRLPGQIVVPNQLTTLPQGLQSQRTSMQLPVTTLPNPVTPVFQTTVSGATQIINTSGIHMGTNVSPPFVNQINNSPEKFIQIVPPGFHSNKAFLLSPIQNSTGIQMTRPALSSILHTVPVSSTAAVNSHKSGNQLAPAVPQTPRNQSLAPAVTASTEGNLRNDPTMSTDCSALSVVSVNSQNPTENNTGNIYEVNIQHSDNEIKSSVDGDQVNGDFAQGVGVQTHQEASSSATEHGSVAVVKSEDSTDGDTDCPMQIRIENIMSLSVCQDAFQQYIQNNAADTIASPESLIENGSNTAEHQTESGSNITEHQTESGSNVTEHQTESGSNNTEHQTETGSNNTERQTESGSNNTEHQTESGSNIAEHKSSAVVSNSSSFLRFFKGYFLCLVCHLKWPADSDSFFKHIWEKHTHEEGVSCCATGYSPYCARLKAIVQAIYDRSEETMPDQIKDYFFTPTSPTEKEGETVPQIDSSEAPSFIVSVRPSSGPHECEQNMPAELVSCSIESRSSPPVTLIADLFKQIEENQNFGVLTADNESDTGTQSIPAIDLSSAAASNSGRASKNKTNTYEDISDDDCDGDINGHNQGAKSIDLLESLYSDDMPLDLSKKTRAETSHDNFTVTLLSAVETAVVNSVTHIERLSPERIETSHDILTITTETAAAISVTQTERLSPENIRICNAGTSFSTTAAPLSMTEASLSLTEAALSKTEACLSTTAVPLSMTEESLSTTEAALSTTEAALSTTEAALSKTGASLSLTEAALSKTEACLSTTAVPLSMTEESLSTTEAALSTTEAALSTTEAALSKTGASLSLTEAALSKTEACLSTTASPLSMTEASLSTTEAALSTTEAALSTTEAALSTTGTSLSLTEAALSKTEACLSTTGASLSLTEAALSKTEACLSTTGASLSMTEASLSTTEAALSTTAVENLRTRTERLSTESTGMGDDDDFSLRCFYVCGICLASWPKAAELEAHIQEVHDLQHDLPCSYCKFRCASSTHLVQHMEEHITINNRKTFSCSLLENSDKVAQFENNDMKFIIRMLKTSVAENNVSDAVFHFACNMCQSEFEDLNKLGVHLQVSLLKVIGCKHCESFFLNSFSWQKHMATEHVDLPRMYCIKRKLLCYERKMYNSLLQDSQEDTLCVSNSGRDAGEAVQENQYHGPGLESQTSPLATSDTLREVDKFNLNQNSKVATESTVAHSNHEGRDVSLVTGIEAETNPEHISAIPKLLDLVKSSKTIKNVLMSAVSLKSGKVSDEQGAVLDAESICSERRRNSVAVEQYVSETCNSTVNERASSGVDLPGLMRPVTTLGNNELTEIVSEVAPVKAVVGVITTVPLDDHCVTKNSESQVIEQTEVCGINKSSLELTETRIRLDVSEQNKLEYTENACLTAPDIGSDIIDNRQEIGHSSPAVPAVQYDLENGVSNIFKESEIQAVSVAVNESDSSQTDFLSSYPSSDGGYDNIEIQADVLLSGNIQHTNEAARDEDSFISVSITEDPLNVSLENRHKSVEHIVFLQTVKSATVVDQACKSAQDSEIGMDDQLTEPSNNDITPFISPMNSVLKTVSYDSGGIPNPVSNSLNPDHDSGHQVDLGSSEGPVCTLQESGGDFVESGDILENDTSPENDVLHLNMDKTSSTKEEDRQAEMCSAKQVETCEILNNKNSLISAKVRLYVSNDTSSCMENVASGEIHEESVLKSPSHCDNLFEENNNTAYEDLPLVAANVTENKDSSHTEINELLDGVSIEKDISSTVFRCKCGTLISHLNDLDVNHSESLQIPTSMCVKCRLMAEESLQPDHTVNSENTDTNGNKLLSEKAVENPLQAQKRKILGNSANSDKMSRLENVNSNDVIRCTVNPAESNTVEQTVQLDHSKLFKPNNKQRVASEQSKTKPVLKLDSKTADDNCSMFLSESNRVAHDLTISDGERLQLSCKRKSEAEHGEGMINSKQMKINSEKYKPEESIKQLQISVGAHQSFKDNQGTDVAALDSAKFRCSVCPLYTSQSYTKLKQHIQSRHPQDKSAKVCRIRSKSSESTAGQTEKFENATTSLKEVEKGDLTKSDLHNDITARQHIGVDSKSNIINYSTVVGSKSVDQQKKCVRLDKKLQESVTTQEISEATRKPLAKVQNSDMSVSADSKPCFQCSVCTLLTSHSYTEIKKHVKSQHPKDKSAKVIKIHSKCLLSSAEQFAGPKDINASLKEVDIIRPDLKQYLKCSVCTFGSFHSFTEIKQHIELQHPYDISAKVCRINSKSPQIVVEKFKSRMCVCKHAKCDFTCQWDLEKMTEHINSKHPYYSCGYCKATYTSLKFLKNHLKFLHRGMRSSIVSINTIALDQLFKCVDISYNGQGAECKDITSQTPAKRKKNSKSSLKDSAKRIKTDSQELNSLQTKKHTSSRISDVNMTGDNKNQPPDATENEKSKDKGESHTTIAEALKMSQSTSENILEHSLRKVSPMPEHEASSVEKLTIPPKTAAMSKHGDPLLGKTDRNVLKTPISIKLPQFDLAAGSQLSSSKVMSTIVKENLGVAEKSTSDNISSTFTKTIADTPRELLHSESLPTKKKVALKAASSLSSQPAGNNTSGKKVTEHQKSKYNVMKPLGPSLPSQHSVRKQSSATISKQKNSGTVVKSSSTIDKQELSSIDLSHMPESGNRPDNVQKTFPEICSETASTCTSDTMLLHQTNAAASTVVTPVSSKAQDAQQCGIWMPSQLETKTAAEGDQNKEFQPEGLRTPQSENSISIQSGSKTESMCGNTAATKEVKSVCKNDYPIKCTLCNRIMKCLRDIERHYISNHPRKDIKLTERKSGFVYSNSGKCLQPKQGKEAPTDSYLCYYCAFRTRKRSEVEAHVKSVHPERKVKVFSMCKSKTISKETESPHKAGRSNSPTPSQYACNVCKEVKHSEFQFRLHLAEHSCFKHTTPLTTGASFLCHTCSYVASSSGDLAQHTGQHMSERRFKCFMCEYDGHQKNSVRAHIKSFHNKTVDDDVGVIDRCKQKNADFRPRLVNIDPKVGLTDPFKLHPNYLQKLLVKYGIKMLDLDGDIYKDMYAHGRDEFNEYFAINNIM